VFQDGQGVPTLREYLHVLRRRKWLVLQAIVIVPATAVALSLRQPAVYEASAEVLVNRQNLAAGLAGVDDPTTAFDPNRVMQTQAKLARVPDVARRVLRALELEDRSASDLLGSSSVSAHEQDDLLTFSVSDPSPELAMRLATEYARQFTLYREELDTAALKRAADAVERQIDELKRAGDESSSLYQNLVDTEQQLRTMETLQTARAVVVRPAGGAGKIQASATRNGVIGAVLGFVLGAVLAFLVEALDTRVRSQETIAKRLGLPLLGRIPAWPRRVPTENQLIMVAAPNDPRAEAFRMLRTSLDLAIFDRHARTIMITSAVADEGKSVTAANLAVALAQAGKNVALIDLDLRAGSLARLFRLENHDVGLTNVVLGHVSLDSAIASVPVARSDGSEPPTGNGSGEVDRILHVLPSGPLPPNPGDFVASENVAAILDELSQRADVVLIDTAPLLITGDAMALWANVDALMLVARLNVLRSHMLDELDRVLEASPVTKLGFVLTGVKLEEPYTDRRYANVGPFAKQTSDPVQRRQGVAEGSGFDSHVLGGETTRRG
jgi:Mrp family chromosome partitioning ATPase